MKLRWQGYFAAGLILFFVIVALAAPLISPALDDSLPSYNQVGSARDKVPHEPARVRHWGRSRGSGMFSIRWSGERAMP